MGDAEDVFWGKDWEGAEEEGGCHSGEDGDGAGEGGGEGDDFEAVGLGGGADGAVVGYCFGQEEGAEEDEEGFDAVNLLAGA